MLPPSFDTVSQSSLALPLLERFDATDVAYRHVGANKIEATVMVPKNLPAGPRPLLVRVHGGGMSEGTREAYIRPWIFELALKHNAILVTPDYRLRPEASWEEIMDDLKVFWQWIETDLAAHVRSHHYGIDVDLDNAAALGESAGGYYVVQSALLGFTQRPLKMIILQYPLLDVKGHLVWMESWPEKPPVSVLEEHLKLKPDSDFVTRRPYGSSMRLVFSMMCNGRFAPVDDKHAYLDPLRNIDTAPTLPPTILLHSRDDEAVSASY